MKPNTDLQAAACPKARWWWIGDWLPIGRPLVSAYWRQGHQWPILLALLPVLLVIAGDLWGWAAISAPGCKATYELIAVPLTAAAAAAWLSRACALGSRLALIVAAQAAVFCCREIHFTGTHRGVYVATAVVVVWALTWAWRRRDLLKPENVDWRQVSFLVAAVGTYVLAIVIQKRVFKVIPGERDLHIALEEATETMAHILLVLAALVGRRRRAATQPNSATTG